MNNTSCNQPKVVPELEIPTPRGKEWQLEWEHSSCWQYAKLPLLAPEHYDSCSVHFTSIVVSKIIITFDNKLK